MKPVVSMQFLGDEETVRKAIESVASEGKVKPEPTKAAPGSLVSMVAHTVNVRPAAALLCQPALDSSCLRKRMDQKSEWNSKYAEWEAGYKANASSVSCTCKDPVATSWFTAVEAAPPIEVGTMRWLEVIIMFS
jgi:hypothetical protein